MKTFYASLAAFALLIALIVCNGIYVRRTTAELEMLLSKGADATAFSKAESKWQEHKRLLSLSVSYEEMRELDNQFLAMRAAKNTNSTVTFEKARLLAVESLAHIREFEEFSIDNLI